MGNTIIREKNPETGEIVERRVNLVVVQPQNPANQQHVEVPPEDQPAQLPQRIRQHDEDISCCSKIRFWTCLGIFTLGYVIALSTEVLDYNDPYLGFGKNKSTLYPTSQPSSFPSLAPNINTESPTYGNFSGNLRKRTSHVQQIGNSTASLAI